MNNKQLMWAGIILLVAIVVMNQGKKEGILPPGEYTAYPDESTCTFTTNTESLDTVTDRKCLDNLEWCEDDAWVMIDVDGDGNKEKFGGGASYSSSNDIRACVLPDQVLVENFDGNGNNIGFKDAGFAFYLYICAPTNEDAIRLRQDSGNAAAAIDCQGGCVDECSPGETECIDSNSYRTCGDYDSDDCLEWSSVGIGCDSGYHCEGGSCIQDSCDCTSWSDNGCGNGGCSSSQMYQTRTCNPSGCNDEFRCISDPNCGTTSCWSYNEMIQQMNDNWVSCS